MLGVGGGSTTPSDPSTEVEDGVGVFVREFNPLVIDEEDGSPLVLNLAGDESPLGRAGDGNATHLVGLLVETDKEGGRDYGGGFLEGSLDVGSEFSHVVHKDYDDAQEDWIVKRLSKKKKHHNSHARVHRYVTDCV
jgi:hypothetical protein